MHPAKVRRENIRQFTDLPNIGPAAAKDFERLGFTEPSQLAGPDPLHLYQSQKTRVENAGQNALSH